MSGAETRPARRRIYLAIGLLMLAIAIAGFWPSYFAHFNAPPIIHLHAAIFVGWLALVIAQAYLAAGGRVVLHRKVGGYVFVYGALLIVVGIATALDAFALRAATATWDAAKVGLFVPLTDLLFFAPVLFAAWAYRRRPELHKRLIVVATSVLLIAASHRLIGAHFGRPPDALLVLLVWTSPILAGIAHDAVVKRRVHPVYLLGVAVIVAMKFRPPLHRTDAWDAFCRWLAAALA